MNEQVKEYVNKYPREIVDMYLQLRKIIFDSVSSVPEESLWAKLPSYYIGESFVRLIPFKDHINVEAQAVSLHKEELTDYKITPKGMLQIYLKQDIPYEVLKQIFVESLVENKMIFKELEMSMCEAAKCRDADKFLNVVDENAIMICGGFKCSGLEYAQIIKEFDLAEYEITGYEIVAETKDICQIHYVINTKVADKKNADSEGVFHITSTWKKFEEGWKLVFNMDSRI